jgi:hypothetical protein
MPCNILRHSSLIQKASRALFLVPFSTFQSPGARVVFNFAASDALLAQISKGAPVDVFASADQEPSPLSRE